MSEYPKEWRCLSCGAVMGQVVRDGGGVRRLVLYREATPSPFLPLKGVGDVDVMGVVEGYVADIKCSRCEAVRTWVPGEEAIRRLLERPYP